MSDDELARFLTTASAIYYDQRYLKFGPEFLAEAVDKLSAPGVLSVRSIAAIVGQPERKVMRVWPKDRPKPKVRGTLNPAHIATLGYMLSLRKQFNHEVGYMVTHGTDIGTIASLTNISKTTLQRWRKQ